MMMKVMMIINESRVVQFVKQRLNKCDNCDMTLSVYCKNFSEKLDVNFYECERCNIKICFKYGYECIIYCNERVSYHGFLYCDSYGFWLICILFLMFNCDV